MSDNETPVPINRTHGA